MKITIKQWTVRQCYIDKHLIDPKPQFQRTPVWSEHRKQLLIDSILRGYDIPKLYFNETRSNPHHRYEVADGQQRLRAIWEFIDGRYSLNSVSHSLDGRDLSGLNYGDLPAKVRQQLDGYRLTISIISGAPSNELRVLFARLQMGMSLTPAELRNALPCAIAPAINTLVETHSFFERCRIKNTRYKHQDFLAHALLLSDKNNSCDLKAPDLKEYYEGQVRSYSRALFQKAHAVLDDLAAINSEIGFSITTKWGFVDLFWLIYLQREKGKQPDTPALAKAFVAFEEARKQHVRRPEVLLSRGQPGREMYDYILAFNAGGAKKDNIGTRARVFASRFTRFFSTQ